MSQKRQRRSPVGMNRRLIHYIYVLDQALAMYVVVDTSIRTLTEGLTLTLSVRQPSRLS